MKEAFQIIAYLKDDILYSNIPINKETLNTIQIDKNQMLLIKTIEQLKNEYPNVKLLLVGNGPLFDTYNNYIMLRNNL